MYKWKKLKDVVKMKFGIKTYEQRIGLVAGYDDIKRLKDKAYSKIVYKGEGYLVEHLLFVRDVSESSSKFCVYYSLIMERVNNDCFVEDLKIIDEGVVEISKIKVNKGCIPKNVLKYIYDVVVDKLNV